MDSRKSLGLFYKGLYAILFLTGLISFVLGLSIILLFIVELELGYGLSFSNYAFGILGVFVCFKSARSIYSLIQVRSRAVDVVYEYIGKYKRVLIISLVAYTVLIALLVSSLHSFFPFGLTVGLYLAIFVVDNITFASAQLMKRFGLEVVGHLFHMLRYVAEFVYVFFVVKFVSSFVSSKKRAGSMSVHGKKRRRNRPKKSKKADSRR